DGKQRIAVYTGTGWLTGGFAGGACTAGGGGDGEQHETEAAASALRTALKRSGQTSASAATSAPTSGALHVFKLPWRSGCPLDTSSRRSGTVVCVTACARSA